MPDSPTKSGLNRRYLRVQSALIAVGFILCVSCFFGCTSNDSPSPGKVHDARPLNASAAIEAPAFEIPASLELKLDGPAGERVAFSRDGKKLLTMGSWEAQVWDTSTWQPIAATMRHGGLRMAAFDASGNRLLTVGRGEAIVWDVTTSKPMRTAIRHNHGPVHVAAISPDGRFIATIGEESHPPLRLSKQKHHHVHIWDVASGKIVRSLPHPVPIMDVQFDWIGTNIVTTGEEEGHACTTRLWDAATGSERAILPKEQYRHWGYVKPSLSKSGHLAVPTFRAVEVYDLATTNLVSSHSTVSRLSATPPNIAISEDGTLVASDLTIDQGIWRVSDDQLLVEGLFVDCIALDPTGRTYVRLWIDDGPGIWDIQTNKRLRAFDQSEFWWHCAYSPDGSRIAVTTSRATVIHFARPGVEGTERWQLPDGISDKTRRAEPNDKDAAR